MNHFYKKGSETILEGTLGDQILKQGATGAGWGAGAGALGGGILGGIAGHAVGKFKTRNVTDKDARKKQVAAYRKLGITGGATIGALAGAGIGAKLNVNRFKANNPDAFQKTLNITGNMNTNLSGGLKNQNHNAILNVNNDPSATISPSSFASSEDFGLRRDNYYYH